MIGVHLTVTMNDGTQHSVTITPKTGIAFERHFKIGGRKAFMPDQERVEYTYWLAWDSLRSSGVTVPMFDTWLGEVADVVVGRDDGPK